SRDVSPCWKGCAAELIEAVALLVRARPSHDDRPYLTVGVRSRDVSPCWKGCAAELIEAVALLVRARRSRGQRSASARWRRTLSCRNPGPGHPPCSLSKSWTPSPVIASQIDRTGMNRGKENGAPSTTAFSENRDTRRNVRC